jgi:hypothetical protein
VGRAAALLFVLFGLVASGWTAVHRHHEPQRAKALLETPAGAAAAAELKDAGDQLYLTKRWADTYDGPDLKNFRDLTLVHADDDSFCLEVVKEGHVFRLVGPGGKPEPARC